MPPRCAFVLAAMFIAACAHAEQSGPDGSDEPEDYIVDPDDGKTDGISATFNQHDVVPEHLFLDDGSFTLVEVQLFLEDSPYNNRSWLADYTTASGRTAAQAIYDAALAEGIHPIMLLSRMQGESSVVSKTATPSARTINRALGCGCPDGGSCSSAYRGFEAQLACGAKTMRRWYDASVNETGQWRQGHETRTLDDRRVTPVTHATASIYQYTPWVLPGKGGAWLTWNVTRKYVRHALEEGYLSE
jgi:hypothetical protein